MSTKVEKKIMTLHPEGKNGVNIDRDKYDAMKKAILAAVPRTAEGVPAMGLAKRLRLPKSAYGPGVSVTWYYVTVKLDLEARGLIERVPRSRPQHIRRTR